MTILCRCLFVATVALQIGSCCPASRQSQAVLGQNDNVLGIALHTKAMELVSWHYEPNKLIKTVNALRAMGKQKALESLHIYYYSSWPLDFKKDEDVEIICRFLFVNPDGWKHAGFGVPSPFTRPNSANLFSNFPIAISNGIPFLLASGYASGGGGPIGYRTLDQCADLQSITNDIMPCNRKSAIAAAEALVSSDAFKQLYRDDEQTAAAKSFIMAQAKRVHE